MADEAADGDGGGSGRPSTLSLVAGAIVVAVAVVVGGALVVSSDIGDVISGRDRHELDVALVGDSFADQARAGFLEHVLREIAHVAPIVDDEHATGQ